MTWFEIIMSALTAIYVAVTGFYAWTTHKTLKVVRGQLDAMKESGNQTSQLINHAEAQVIALKTTAEAAKKASDVAERALHLSERADILLDEAGLTTGQELRWDSVIFVQFKNFGRTQAKDALFDISLLSNNPNVPNSESKHGPMVIGAGNTQSVQFGRFNDCLTADTFRQFEAGKFTFSFKAVVNYRDIFDQPHQTRCGGRFDHKTFTFIIGENQAD